MKKTVIEYLKIHFLYSFLIISTLMMIHYPNLFYDGNTIKYLGMLLKFGNVNPFLEFLGAIILYSILFIPFLVFSKVKYIGWIPLAVFSIFTGLEKYIFYLQGEKTPWNIGFNDGMLTNFMVNPTGISDSLDSYGGDIHFTLYLFVFPFILFLILLYISSKLPKMKNNELYKPIKFMAFLIIVLAPTFFTTPAYVPYMFRVHYTISERISSVLYEYSGIHRKEPYFKNIVKKETPKNILFIMDESVRGDLLSINNPNEKDVMTATKYLYSLKDKIINFGNLYSTTNCSFPSNQSFIIGKYYNKIAPHYLNTAPTIFQYMQNAGYTTYFVDNVHSSLYLVFKNYDKKFLDHSVNEYLRFQKIKTFDRDKKTLDIVRGILNNGDKNFIYVLKYGIHFPFEHAFDKDNPLFKDWNRENALGEYKLYLNALNESVDNYFKYLIDVIGVTDTVLLWQSDHSVNITRPKDENRVVLTHCESGMTYAQEMHSIPGIMYSPNKKWYKGYHNLKHGYSVSHMMPTILDLAGYSEKDYSKYYGNSFKNPSPIVEIKNMSGFFRFGDENTSNIYTVVDMKKREMIDPLNKRRTLKNTLPNRKFIIKEDNP